jgi:hypothetical protein
MNAPVIVCPGCGQDVSGIVADINGQDFTWGDRHFCSRECFEEWFQDLLDKHSTDAEYDEEIWIVP